MSGEIGKCAVCGGTVRVSMALIASSGKRVYTHAREADWKEDPHEVILLDLDADAIAELEDRSGFTAHELWRETGGPPEEGP